MAASALAMDEKADKKRHNCLTLVSDGSRVLHVAEGRREDSLAENLNNWIQKIKAQANGFRTASE